MPEDQTAFPHLPLPYHQKGKARLHGGGRQESRTIDNRNNRITHSNNLRNTASQIIQTWSINKTNLSDEQKELIPTGTPLLLEIEEGLDLTILQRSFNFEIVSELSEGYVIVATNDFDLNHFLARVDEFKNAVKKGGRAAQVYELKTESQRLENILSENLFLKWGNIKDDDILTVDIGISVTGTIPIDDFQDRRIDESNQHFEIRKQKWIMKKGKAEEEIERVRRERETEIDKFVNSYRGQINDIIDVGIRNISQSSGSFTARIRINGKGLRDLAYNFPYIFEIIEPQEIESTLFSPSTLSKTIDIEILPPEDNDPAVCVIDSGIQENHKFLLPAIDATSSFNYVPRLPETDTADNGVKGGHGTRVAGAILYRESIPESGTIKLPFWIQNARVLGDNRDLSSELMPSEYLNKIISRYSESDKQTKIFNHSITSIDPYRSRHMSDWAAIIDKISYEKDVLFIQSAGNIDDSNTHILRKGIKEYLSEGIEYPHYLIHDLCRIADPGQSLNALTVGSISYEYFEDGLYKSISDGNNRPSSFSRTGLGIWETIKPEVVEHGGDYVRDLNNPPSILIKPETSPNLIRATDVAPSPAYDRDTVGTSFSAPKVAHLAARLQSLFPDEPALLYRALIIQSALWPEWTANSDDYLSVIRHIGFGIPNEERATRNTPYRITLITHGCQTIFSGMADVYRIPLPKQLINPAFEYRIKIEVTLSYASQPRRTRRHPRGYLSIWLDWITCNRNESIESFLGRALKETEGERDITEGIQWALQKQNNHGTIRGVSRNKGTIQKDWALLQSNELPEDFTIAVVGHRGWDKDPESVAKYALAVSFEAIDQDIEIYQEIRNSIEELIQQTHEIRPEIEIEVDN